jgi:hypothetical protein
MNSFVTSFICGYNNKFLSILWKFFLIQNGRSDFISENTYFSPACINSEKIPSDLYLLNFSIKISTSIT